MPMPPPDWRRKVRRVTASRAAASRAKNWESLQFMDLGPGNGFVEVQEDVGGDGVGGKFAGRERGFGFGVSFAGNTS